MVAVAVLAASCGGGTLEAPPQSPDPPAVVVEAAPAETASVEAAVAEAAPVEAPAVEAAPVEEAVVDSTAVEVPTTAATAAPVVDSEASATAAAAPSKEPAAVSEPPIELTAPLITIAERSVIRADESVMASAVEAMLRDLQPRRVVLVRVFYAIDERAIADFCTQEPSGDGSSYSHVQRGVDLRAAQWEIVSAFEIRVVDDLESCIASFN